MATIIMIILIYLVWWGFIIFNYSGLREAVYAYYHWHLNADNLFGGAGGGIDEWAGGGLIGGEVWARFATVSRDADKSA